MSEISERLYKAILAKEYSYGDMARMTGIPKSAIQRYATGETGKIPLDRLKVMASVLGVSAEYLMGCDGPNPAKSEETIPEDMPEIIMVARAGRKMTQQNREDMIKILRIAFPDAFSEDD